MVGAVFAHGGLVIWAIVIASLVGLTVAIERTWRYAGWHRRSRETHARCREILSDGRRLHASRDLDQTCNLGRVLAAGLGQWKRGTAAVQDAAWAQAQSEVGAIERGLGVLAAVAQVTPLLGLLGTVVGLMRAFRDAAAADQVTTTLLADGLYQALGTTAAGLVVAIPAYLAYNGLSGSANRLIAELEQGVAMVSRWRNSNDG